MKVLLVAINSKFIHMNPAVYSLRACCGEYRSDVEIAEYTINQERSKILEDIYEHCPTVISISCYIWNMDMVARLLPELHLLLPELPIWLGGPEVSYRAELVMQQFPYLRGIMIGEGEKTFYDLCDYYAKNEPVPKDVPGIYGSNRMAEPMNMDDIPFWYEENSFEDRITYYESSRGCPYRCGYCLSSIDKTLRFRSMEKTLSDLQWFIDRQVPQVKLIDRTFNCNVKRARTIWQYITDHDNGVTNFHFEIAGDLITDEDIDILCKMRSGLVQFEIGVQSTNETVLKEAGRTTDMTVLSENIKKLLALKNIHIHLDLIAGLPGEDYQSFVKSFCEVYSFYPEQLQLGFLKVLSGTQMWNRRLEYGLVASPNPPYEVLETSDISYGEILQLKKVEEVLEIYYNSNQFENTLRLLERQFESSYEMYHSLANYYEEMGYFLKSPARNYRYDVLLEFAKKTDKNREDLYREALIYDLYLRENVKTRPAFATETEEDKVILRAFYRQEEENRQYLKGYEAYSARQMIRMTHMEGFYYSVWEEEPVRSMHKTYLCFDYETRNPLNHNAKVLITQV